MTKKRIDKGPRLSIIVPAFNAGEFLVDCVQSILSSTFTNFELILVDDSSTDSTESVCRAFARVDDRVRYIRNRNNRGQGSCRNVGLALALGELVSFVDADDIVDSRMYEVMIGLMDKHGVDLVRCGLRRFRREASMDDDLQSWHARVLEGGEYRAFVEGYFGPLPEQSLDEMPSMSPCTAVYRKRFIDEFGLEFPVSRSLQSEDLFFNLAYGLVTKNCVILDSCLYWYRVTSGSTSRTYTSPVSKVQLLETLARSDSLRLRRLERTKLNSVKEAAIQLTDSSLPISGQAQVLKELLDELDVSSTLGGYPVGRLSWRERLFAKACEHRFTYAMVILSMLYVVAIRDRG